MSTSITHKICICLFALGFTCAFAAVCSAQEVKEAAIKKAIASLSPDYDNVPSSISCKAPGTPAEKIICADKVLQLMEILDSRAAIYMIENGTKREIPHNKTSVVKYSLIKTIQKLNSPQAIRKAYINNTNDSLGGESPYYINNP
jgi:hypothetical protein